MLQPLYSLPVWDTIKAGWEKKNGVKGTIWLALIIVILISIVGNFLVGMIAKTSPVFGGLLSFILQIFIFLLTAGIYYIGVCVARDKPVNYTLMFRGLQSPYNFRLILVYILLVLIFTCLSLLGFIPILVAPHAAYITIPLAVIIGIFTIFVAIRLSLSLLFVIAEESGPIEAIKLSWQATRGNFWNLIAVIFLLVIFTIISAIPLGIGLIWTIPFGYVTFGLVYKELLANVPSTVVPNR